MENEVEKAGPTKRLFPISERGERIIIPSVLSLVAILVSAGISTYQTSLLERQIEADYDIEDRRLRIESFRDFLNAYEVTLTTFDVINNELFKLKSLLSKVEKTTSVEGLEAQVEKVIAAEAAWQNAKSKWVTLTSRDQYIWKFPEPKAPFSMSYNLWTDKYEEVLGFSRETKPDYAVKHEAQQHSKMVDRRIKELIGLNDEDEDEDFAVDFIYETHLHVISEFERQEGRAE